jgi:hypothetical protein
VWATPCSIRNSKLVVKLIVRDFHHLVNELWPPLEHAYELQILKHNFSHILILYTQNMLIFFHRASSPIMSSKSRIKKNKISIGAQFGNLNFATIGSSHILLNISSPHFHNGVGFHIQVAGHTICWWQWIGSPSISKMVWKFQVHWNGPSNDVNIKNTNQCPCWRAWVSILVSLQYWA